MNFIVFTSSDLTTIEAINSTTDLQVRPRLVDNPSYSLYGLFVAPDSILTGEYGAVWSNVIQEYPTYFGDPENLFIREEI